LGKNETFQLSSCSSADVDNGALLLLQPDRDEALLQVVDIPY